mmetsp:Transcript_59842/g.103082  ORF Transcript_59842/g.103082 Transcript_59842/m.103082 type:complete len:98 (+) Transcript_59842:109-402(+)
MPALAPLKVAAGTKVPPPFPVETEDTPPLALAAALAAASRAFFVGRGAFGMGLGTHPGGSFFWPAPVAPPTALAAVGALAVFVPNPSSKRTISDALS